MPDLNLNLLSEWTPDDLSFLPFSLLKLESDFEDIKYDIFPESLIWVLSIHVVERISWPPKISDPFRGAQSLWEGTAQTQF